MTLNAWTLLPHLDDDFPLALDAPFTVSMARSAGVPRRWLKRLVDEGLLRHPIKGCYIAAQAPDDTRTRAECLKLVAPADAVIVDRHAGWLQGANMLLLPNEHLEAMPVTMYLPAASGRRLRASLADSGERTFQDEDITQMHGLRVTTPLRTALDLGRQRWPEAAISALDALHRLGTFSVEELVAEVPRFAGMRWVTTLRRVAAHTDGRSMSGGESVVRWRWLASGRFACGISKRDRSSSRFQFPTTKSINWRYLLTARR